MTDQVSQLYNDKGKTVHVHVFIFRLF